MMKHPFTVGRAGILALIISGMTTIAATTAFAATVELPDGIHFLTPAGDNVTVAGGVYEVTATETWLKLVPAGNDSTGAILLDARPGPHDEEIQEPVAHIVGDPDRPELVHLALLLPDGTGVEALGSTTGIQPRASRFAFVGRTHPKAATAGRAKVSATTKPRAQTSAPFPRPKGTPVDCGPYQQRIGKAVDLEIEGNRSIALAVFQNRLHMVAVNFWRLSKVSPVMRWATDQSLHHWQFDGTRWQPYRHPGVKDSHITKWGIIPGQYSKAGVALSVFRNQLHMVHIGKALDLQRDPNNLWHSTFDGNRWTRNVKIPGQKSKGAPALATWNHQLHLVHQGDRSNNLWHSINKGNGWTVNVRIPGASSDRAPALSRVPNGPLANRLHMAYETDANIEPQSLWHKQFDGRTWGRSSMIRGALTKAAPTLVPHYPNGMDLIHLGKGSDNVWHIRFGPNGAKRRMEWYDDRPLLNKKSRVPVGVALYQGCYHMVSREGDHLIHTKFSTSHVHPTAR